jgi:uroporphyrin-III C-methyltransferase/precorrin-2 dehydrogenase/sirohydrochlorin ferrochelatase
MQYFPLFHRLNKGVCLIIGGGHVAQRRARALISAGATVHLISKQILPKLESFLIDSGASFDKQAVDLTKLANDYELVVAATNDKAVNLAIANYANLNRIPVNVVDDPAAGDFIFPAVIERASLTVAVSNSGNSPVLSRLLKQQIDAYIPSTFAALSDFVGSYRQRVKVSIPEDNIRKTFWENIIQGGVAEAIYMGKEQRAHDLFESALADPEKFNLQGEVYLIGAGPGDPELLTLKAFRLLQKADVVLYDRLVSAAVMAFIPPEVELIYVGKNRDNHAVPQDDINQLLVDQARKGKRVVRLKGGDPFIFGRGGEEIQTLVDFQVPFQIVPGITAASGCSAYAGIPLTHRDYAQSVQFVTGQLKSGTVDLDWAELISPGKTLVFYMGLKSLPIICESLITYGMQPDTHVALIEKGTTHEQRVLVSNLTEIESMLASAQVSSPSLFIVGSVVQLAEKLSWFDA